MTGNRPQRPQPPSRPNRDRGQSSPPSEFGPKPYDFVTFPSEKPQLEPPAGHHKYFSDHWHGTLFLTLKVQTALHVSTGVVVMGSDIGSRVPLIKTMVQGIDQHLSIQGSSLKGCIRPVYEAITNSTLAVITSKYKSQIPPERLPCRNKAELCPTSRVFGALDWQGLIEFNDAKCETSGYATGFMPSLYRPRPDQRQAYFGRGRVAGRKFYYHTIRAIDKGQNSGIAVQQAAKQYIFTTQVNFKNLKSAELGTLLIVLGQDQAYPIALKVGGGKPIGMGTMTVTVNEIEAYQNLRDRYSDYMLSESSKLTGQELQQFIQKQIQAAQSLIEKPQLQQLTEILRYPTDREPPTGMY